MAIAAARYSEDLASYAEDGRARAAELGNRGPLRFDGAGRVHPDIIDAYHRHGFYVLEGVVDEGELGELRADVAEMIDRAPVRRGAELDRQGRPALGRDHAIDPYLLIEPLSDPWGGTAKLGGRHPTKMAEPTPDVEVDGDVVHLMFGMCRTMPSALRLYGHPHLLAVAAAINGPDFVPFNDAVFVKQPGLGGSVSWHQDGVTHWDSPDWDEGIHGFNFQVQLYDSTPANGLWVVPGSHREGKIDIPARVAANGGDERLPDAVPMCCRAGDVTVANRQILHGSFANTSSDPRISVTFGFHRRSSVLGVEGKLRLKADDGTRRGEVYDEDRIDRRSAVVALAIDARHRHRPDETRYPYAPFVGREDRFRADDPEVCRRVLVDYNTNDLSI
jgi:ectoine hydroxylase-related dioxygenase (phytanoyl-CoA dioxygenase family)